MLEPLIVLTVLNSIFMFSSTITTCALWWQYQSHRCCVRRNAAHQRSDLRRRKSSDTFRAAKKLGKSQLDANTIGKPTEDSSRESKRSRKKRSHKSLKYLAEYQKRKEEEKRHMLSAKSNPRRLEEKTRTSEASQTINDAKSTVVMEFSTVQKVVQIVDNDADVNSTRAPFREIVIQRDTADKRYNYDVEQNFTADVPTVENS